MCQEKDPEVYVSLLLGHYFNFQNIVFPRCTHSISIVHYIYFFMYSSPSHVNYQSVPQTSISIWSVFLIYVFNMYFYTYAHCYLKHKHSLSSNSVSVFLCGNMFICVSCQIIPISNIIVYFSFAFQITSCFVIKSRLIYGAAKSSVSLFSMANIPLCTPTTSSLSIHVDGHFGCFLVLPIVNTAAVQLLQPVSSRFCSSLVIGPALVLLDQMVAQFLLLNTAPFSSHYWLLPLYISPAATGHRVG